MKKIFKPNYNRSIINIPATIMEYAGVKNDYPKSAILKKELRKNYKNIVFMIFDGMGSNIINKLLPKDNILRQGVSDTLHSVFPPTTTAATTTFLTGQYPSEHGWLGWNMYFEDIDIVLDLFTNKESFSQETMYPNYISKTLPLHFNILDKIDEKGRWSVSTVYPKGLSVGYKRNYEYSTTKEMFSKIKKCLTSSKRQFVYCYNDKPDSIMHEEGPYANSVKEYLLDVSNSMEKLIEACPNTLFVVSADHGQVDIKNRIFLHNYEDVCDLLIAPPYLDSRTISFRVKEHERVTFYNLFNKYFGNEFVLLTKHTVLKKKLFGPKTDCLEKYIGDFVAIAVGESIIQYKPDKDGTDLFVFKGHHAGLTKAEVEVPLILIGNK
jgi:hypothetical protein